MAAPEIEILATQVDALAGRLTVLERRLTGLVTTLAEPGTAARLGLEAWEIHRAAASSNIDEYASSHHGLDRAQRVREAEAAARKDVETKERHKAIDDLKARVARIENAVMAK